MSGYYEVSRRKHNFSKSWNLHFVMWEDGEQTKTYCGSFYTKVLAEDMAIEIKNKSLRMQGRGSYD